MLDRFSKAGFTRIVPLLVVRQNTFPCRLVWWSNPALPHYSQATWLMTQPIEERPYRWGARRHQRIHCSDNRRYYREEYLKTDQTRRNINVYERH